MYHPISTHIKIALVICSVINFFAVSISYAENTPITPTSRKAIIDDLQKDIEKQKHARKESLKQVKEFEKNISKTRTQLAALGKQIKSSETQMVLINDALSELTLKQENLRAQIDTKKLHLSKLMIALHRLKHMPPEIVLLQEGKPLEIAQSAMILDTSLKTIRQKSIELKSLLEQHRKTHGTLLDKREKASMLQRELNSQFKELSKLLEKREKSFTREKIILSGHTSKINAMAKKAKNLEDLIKNLKKQTPKNFNDNRAPSVLLPNSALPKHGEYILPLSGFIRTSYGVKDRFGGTSKGYHIESYIGALVIAPFSGQIKYAGPFKNHQNVVIIEHKSGYHSLLSGLSKIDVHIGQIIYSGEALGLLGNSNLTKEPSSKSELYYELRKNGEPLNPSILFSDLG
jgi:septal ring factor EnvC (AmiA/AmiB activator)